MLKEIPLLPLRDVVVYPHMVIPLFVGRAKSIRALEAAMAGDKQVANPSLAQDLYSFSKIDSPEKLAHRMARLFNKSESNPWYRKIKILYRSEFCLFEAK